MSEPAKNAVEESTIAAARLAEFERAWMTVSRGASAPKIEDFTVGLTGENRSQLIAELQKLETAYCRQILDPEGAETLANSPNKAVDRALPASDHEVTMIVLKEAKISPDDSALPVASDITLARPGRRPRRNDFAVGPDPDQTAQGQTRDGSAIVFRPNAERDEVQGYEILGELGRGGMGVVYKARQKGLNRIVALKMVLAGEHAAGEQLNRFRVEAEAVASIQHPNIVQIFDVGESKGLPYFSLEFIEGGSLDDVIKGKPMLPRKAAQLTEALARAMHCAHTIGVVHRDLKPANILMTLEGVPKITDFGLAKRIEEKSHQTRTGSMMGTPSYMAPEQARGDTHAIGPKSDQYSLGSLLYEMLTGRPPFQGSTSYETLDMVRLQEPVPPTRLQPKVPKDLETICLKSLQKEQSKRYAQTGDMADDLARFLAGEVIQARPVGKVEQSWRWCRRNPRIAGLSAAVGVLIVAVATGLGYFAIRRYRDQQTLLSARTGVERQLVAARAAVADANVEQAKILLASYDTLVQTSASFRNEREELRKLRAQVSNLSTFVQLLERTRQETLVGGESKLAQNRKHCQELLTFYDQIENRRGNGADGLPMLSDHRKQLFYEDVVDTFLIASQIEYDLGLKSGDEKTKKEAADQAIKWLDRAVTLVPPTRAIHVRRYFYRAKIDDIKGRDEDKKAYESIPSSSPIDRFWSGYAHRVKCDVAIEKKDMTKAKEQVLLAKSEFSKLLQARPENFWGYFEWSGCEFRLGAYADAIVGFTTCAHLRPKNPWPFHNRANCHLALGEFEEAIQDETQAMTVQPDFSDPLLGRGKAYLRLGHIEAAFADFEDLLRADPTNVDGRLQRGAILFQRGEIEKARDDFSAVLAAMPESVDALRSHAFISLLLGNLDAVHKDWAAISALQPTAAEPHFRLGVHHLGRFEYEQAAAELKKAIELDPGHALAYLAQAQMHHWNGRPALALKDIDYVLDVLVQKNPKLAASYLIDRPDVLRSVGRLDVALADTVRSIQLDPTQIDAYITQSLICAKKGDEVGARSAYESMVLANPKSVDALLRRAEFHRNHREFSAAIADCERARAIGNPKSTAQIELVMASIFAADGHPEQAMVLSMPILSHLSNADGHVLYAAACVYSLAFKDRRGGSNGSADLPEDRAVELLTEALTKRFHDFSYQEHNRMAEDPALAPIANRPEVRRLLTHGVVNL